MDDNKNIDENEMNLSQLSPASSDSETDKPELVLEDSEESLNQDYESLDSSFSEIEPNLVEAENQTEELTSLLADDDGSYKNDPADNAQNEIQKEYDSDIEKYVDKMLSENVSGEPEKNDNIEQSPQTSLEENDSEYSENQSEENDLQQQEEINNDNNSNNYNSADDNNNDNYDDDYIDEYENEEAEENDDEENSSSDDEEEEEDIPEYSQKESIDNAEPTEKEDSEHVNKARFLNRNKILFVIVGSFLILLIFFSFILPVIKDSKNKGKKKETTFDKAASVQIPKEVTDIPDQVITSPDSSTKKEEDMYDYYEDEDLSEKFKDPALPSDTEPAYSYYYTQPQDYGYSNTEEEDSNADELQKPFTDVPLQDQDISKINNILQTDAQNKYAKAQAAIAANTYQHYTPATPENTSDAVLLSLLNNASNGGQVDTYKRLNDQESKQNFRNNNAGSGGTYNYIADNTLWKGTIIPAVLDTAINTDLPGLIKAHVTQNIYSSNNGRYLIIPQGSILIAEYNSSVSYAQDRVQVAWNTLIRPDGLEVNLGSMDGVDTEGHTGYKGIRTEHPFEYAKAFGLIAAYSLITTKAEMVYASRNKGNHYVDNLKDALTGPIDGYAQDRINNLLDIQPTINIKSGEKINIITNVTMELPPLLPPAPTKKVKVRNH